MISEQELLNARILIVDDQRSMILLLEAMLREAGYVCIASTMDPHAVCELHRKNNYDLILLDLEMPDMDGFQVMEGLKEIATDDYIPVLVLTAQPEHMLRALSAGAKDFVTKPFDQDEVQRRIHNMLEVHLLHKKLENHNKLLAQMVQKRAAELREAKTLLHRNQTLMQNSMDGIHVMDRLGNIVETNDAFCHMLGYTREEMARLNVADWDAQWSAEELRERFKSFHVNRARFETIHRRKDGTLINVEVSTSAIAIEEPHFIFASSRDITERKRAEQELIVLNNHLTHEVSKRTADLSALTAHNQKIAETEKANLARELHDELGSTLVGISMEIGRLRGKISAPDHLQDLSVIKDLISSASQITRGVVDQLYPTVLDTYGFVAAVEWLINGYRKRSGITVELAIQKEEIVMEPTFALAAYRITQECMTNIAKHAGASKVHIEAKVSDGFLDMIIHDNGKGLPREISVSRHGIFGMIERARYLGGSMEIGSEDGKGTAAHLILPLAAAKPKIKKRVLIVDDHAIVRNALRQLLDDQTDDFSVEGEAADGNTGIQMAIEGVWDIMLLDITLPKKNGLKVLEEIMAVKSNLPIIMLSSHAQEEYGAIALAKGAACYIEKGETSKLVEAMRRAILH